jgi:hypothetical protein
VANKGKRHDPNEGYIKTNEDADGVQHAFLLGKGKVHAVDPSGRAV